MRFKDRSDAGRHLAVRLTHLRSDHVVVVGLPRGGIPVAAEVARELGAPLDVIVVRKLGVPFQPLLMLSNAPEALAYQRQLGEAYLREGFEKTGNLRDALHYYHGGPDRRQWGPKTRAYANSVLRLIGSP